LQWIVVGAAVIAATAGVAVAQATDQDQVGEAEDIIVIPCGPTEDPEHGVCLEIIGNPTEDEQEELFCDIPAEQLPAGAATAVRAHARVLRGDLPRQRSW
jgi:hypothetical protein